MSQPDFAELACTYAALILHDEKIPVTADKIATLVKAANVEVPAFWPGIFARVLEKRNIDDLLSSAGGSGGSGPATGAVKQEAKEEKKGGDDKKKGEEKKKPKEEPKEEEEDADMGLGLFD